MPQIVICYADFFHINRFIAKDKTKLAKLRAKAFGVKKNRNYSKCFKYT